MVRNETFPIRNEAFSVENEAFLVKTPLPIAKIAMGATTTHHSVEKKIKPIYNG
jgi:hypothetical protein